MNAKNLMTPNPKVCTPSMTSEAAARIMEQENVGALPVIDGASKKLIGIVTDRDLCLGVIAKGYSPAAVTISNCMTTHLLTCGPQDNVEYCEQLMKQHQVRRIVVIDEHGCCMGIISQGDLALYIQSPQEIYDTLREVSRPGHAKRAA
ncbi:CBS domain-containing protein [Nitrospira sp. Nam74]